MCFGLTSLSLIALDPTESPRYTLKTVKHGGGNVIVWGSFSWCGVGPLHRIQGTIDQHMYKEKLENVMLPYAEENLPLVWKFQQDNNPKHTAKSVKSGLTLRRLLYWSGPHSNQTYIQNKIYGRKLTET